VTFRLDHLDAGYGRVTVLREVTVTVEPAGAEVWDGDRLVGPAPTVVKIARNAEPHTLYIKKNGFLTAQRVVQTKDDQALKLRLTAKPRPEGEGGEDGAAPPEAATPKPTPPPMPVAVTPPPKTVAPAPPPKSVQMADKGDKTLVKPLETLVTKPAPPPKKHHPKPKKEETLILTPSF